MNRKYTTTEEERKRRAEHMKTTVRPSRPAASDKQAGKTRSTLIGIGKKHENLVLELEKRIAELEGELEVAKSRLQRLDNAENILRMNNLDSLL